MGRRKKQSRIEFNHTPTTLLMALFGCACAVMVAEIVLPDLMQSSGLQMSNFPRWQFHMGSTCIGIITFFTFLFFLEFFETGSRITAWHASAPWLPLIGLTLFAAIVHIPFYIVILVGTIYGVWAYRQTSRVRRSPRLP